MVLIILVSPTLNHALITTHWLRARNAHPLSSTAEFTLYYPH
jgi:hypothetical protein